MFYAYSKWWRSPISVVTVIVIIKVSRFTAIHRVKPLWPAGAVILDFVIFQKYSFSQNQNYHHKPKQQ
jgi:hypothetical protein